MQADLKRIVTIAGLVLFLFGLGLFAYLGFFNRYWADDWCYNADLKQLGFWGTLQGYTYITTYASNRFSLTLFSGLFYPLGIFGVQIMSLLVIILWSLGLFCILVNVQAALIVSILPRPAWTDYGCHRLLLHLPYAASVPEHVLEVGSASVYGDDRVERVDLCLDHLSGFAYCYIDRIGITTALVTFLAGGFSEAGGATLTAMLAAYVALCLWFRQKAWAKNSLPLAIIALISSILAIVALIAAPTNAYRIGLYGRPTDLLAFPGRLLYFTSDFIKYSFFDMPLPHLFVLATLFSLGVLFYAQNGKNMDTRNLLLLVLFIALLTFLCVAATYAPSAYIEKSPPAPRTRIISRFILTLGMGTIALLVGYYFRQIFNGAGWIAWSSSFCLDRMRMVRVRS